MAKDVVMPWDVPEIETKEADAGKAEAATEPPAKEKPDEKKAQGLPPEYHLG